MVSAVCQTREPRSIALETRLANQITETHRNQMPVIRLPEKGSKISCTVSNQAESMALLPCWILACAYKMAQESQEQSWPIKHH